jgi:hypothetical protein
LASANRSRATPEKPKQPKLWLRVHSPIQSVVGFPDYWSRETHYQAKE